MALRGRVTAYLPEEVQKALEEWAEAESRSISSLATYLLTKAVKERQEPKTKDSDRDNWVIKVRIRLPKKPGLYKKYRVWQWGIYAETGFFKYLPWFREKKYTQNIRCALRTLQLLFPETGFLPRYLATQPRLSEKPGFWRFARFPVF